jgi:hypothetical protein
MMMVPSGSETQRDRRASLVRLRYADKPESALTIWALQRDSKKYCDGYNE